jgi:hypothetical protein
MKTKILILTLVFSGIISCHSQNSSPEKQKPGMNKPHTNVTVNKKYDENGHLILFDSTYTSYYSNIEGDTIPFDGIPEDFQMYFNHRLPGITSNNIFDVDSSFMPGFFHDDFFEHQFFNQDEQLLRMMQEMDSIKNEFFKINSQQQHLNQ